MRLRDTAMVPFRVNLLIMRLYGVPRCSRFLDEVADGIVLKTFVHNIYEYIVRTHEATEGK